MIWTDQLRRWLSIRLSIISSLLLNNAPLSEWEREREIREQVSSLPVIEPWCHFNSLRSKPVRNGRSISQDTRRRFKTSRSFDTECSDRMFTLLVNSVPTSDRDWLIQQQWRACQIGRFQCLFLYILYISTFFQKMYIRWEHFRRPKIVHTPKNMRNPFETVQKWCFSHKSVKKIPLRGLKPTKWRRKHWFFVLAVWFFSKSRKFYIWSERKK